VLEAASQRLAVHGHEQSGTVVDQRRRPVHEALFEGQRIEQGKDTVEGIVAGNPVGQFQDRLEPLDIAPPPCFDELPTFRSA
jgi:hypothetical protein